jgi:hypothetical protein
MPATRYVEPCRGQGLLIGHLTHFGHRLVSAHDLPDDDARTTKYDIAPGEIFLTNPPWSRELLHAITVNLSNQAPAWLLIDADWPHTRQAIPYLLRLRMIISVGRVRWIENSKFTSKDNAIWALFDRPNPWATTRFVGRQEGQPEGRRYGIEAPSELREVDGASDGEEIPRLVSLHWPRSV